MLATAGKGSVLSLAGTFIGKALSLFLRFLIIRLLGAKDFGFFAIAMALIEFVRIIASIGLPRGGMRFLAKSLGSKNTDFLPKIMNTAILIPVLLSLACSGLFYLGAGTIATVWFHNPELIPVFHLFALAIPCVTLLKLGTELSRGFFTTRYAVLVENFIVPVLLPLVFLSLYFFNHTFNALIYAFIIANAVGAACIVFFLFRQAGRVLPPLPQAWIFAGFSFKVIRYSFPLFLSGITAVLMGTIDIFMLGRFVDADSVGVYAAASMVAVFLSTSLVIPVNSIFAPLVAGHHHHNDLTTLHHLYIATTRWVAFLAIPLILCVILLRSHIMAIFGTGFVETGSKVLLILAVGHLVNCLTGGVGQILSMAGHPKKELSINLLIVILNMGLNLLLIPRYGLTGAACATAIALGSVNLLRVIVVFKIFKIQPFTLKLARIFVLGFFLGLVALLFQQIAHGGYDFLFALGACGLLIWFIAVTGFEPEDKDVLSQIQNRVSQITGNRR